MRKRTSAAASERRSYQQLCGVARALDVVGERWTLLIVRNLLLGPRRYSDLLAELPGITTNLLAKRLQDMEGAGLVEKSAEPGTVRYQLTARGLALEPVVMELGRWGWPLLMKPRPGDRPDLGLSLLSLKRRYVGGLRLTVGLNVDGRGFTLMLGPKAVTVRDQPAQHPDLTISGTLANVRALLFAGEWAKGLPAAPRLAVVGDEAHWTAFRGAFRLDPGPAAAA
jgi:DNA-binding HxlR family transcriptional regulator